MPQAKKRKIQKKRAAVISNVFDSEAVFGNRVISDHKKLKKAIEHCKGLGLRIVLTSGTWDLVHIGHARYMEEAKRHGDLLVVGVDCDKKVQARKGPDRPVVPEDERMEMITHLRYVDLVVLKQNNEPKWHLIKLVKPDVLILTDETYDKKTQKDLKKYCGEIVVLKPQATTSTSAKIRRLQISTAKKLQDRLTPRLMQTIEDVLSEIKEEKLKK
jgi:D-glycero-beta-D-manno-heptose 1-phosphate adenylyltransferase